MHTATDASKPELSSTPPSAGKSAGIAFGTIAGIALIVAIAYLALRARREKTRAKTKETGKGSEWWDEDSGKAGDSATAEGLAGGIRIVRDN